MNFVTKLIVLMLISKSIHAQVSVQLLNENNIAGSPEIYFKFKLQDTIFSKHEGLKLKNFASVKFDVSKNGIVSNVDFSISTDSLLEPYINDVLMSTNHHWIVTKKGKRIKATIILPIIFTLRPKIHKVGPTRMDDFGEKPFEDIEFEATHLFQFDKANDNLLLFYRNPIKYDGITLNPIEVRVPYDPDADDY